MQSSTYVTILAMVLVPLLARFGVTIGNDSLTSAIEVLVQIVGGLVIAFKHRKVVSAARSAGVKGI